MICLLAPGTFIALIDKKVMGGSCWHFCLCSPLLNVKPVFSLKHSEQLPIWLSRFFMTRKCSYCLRHSHVSSMWAQDRFPLWHHKRINKEFDLWPLTFWPLNFWPWPFDLLTLTLTLTLNLKIFFFWNFFS